MRKSKAKMKKGILHIGYAMIVDSEGDSIDENYEDIKWLPSLKAGGREWSADPRGDTNDIYADSIKVYADSVNDGYDIKLTLLAVTDDVDGDWLGEKKVKDGIAEYANGEEYPYFALIIVEDTADGEGKTTIFPRCQAAGRPSDNGKTKEGGSFDFEFPEYSITASPRIKDRLVRYRKNGKSYTYTELPEPEEVTETVQATYDI